MTTRRKKQIGWALSTVVSVLGIVAWILIWAPYSRAQADDKFETKEHASEVTKRLDEKLDIIINLIKGKQ